MNFLRAAACSVLALNLIAADPPALRPGEGLAFADLEGRTETRGDASVPGPLGDLSSLLWLRLEGYDWASWRVSYKCSGREGELACTSAKGHGRVDLSNAFERNCRLAVLSWIRQSAALKSRLEGDAVARIRLQEVFGPFSGPRFPKGEKLPAFGLEWAGEGDLLRASPASLAGWLADPSQEQVSGLFKRYGSGFFEGEAGTGGWVYVGHAGAGEGATTWVAGGQSGHVAVMRIPGTLDRPAALRRFREAASPAQPSAAKKP
jgi:hypothetical protein